MKLKKTGGDEERPKDGRAEDCRRPVSRFSAHLLEGAMILALVAPAAGCARAFYARAPEQATELGNAFDSLSPQALGFIKGRTRLEDAVRTMERRGIKHIVQNTTAGTGKGTTSALAGDFQHYIHIFRDERYEQSVRLAINPGELPARYAVRVADYSGSKMILALVRDAAGIERTMMAMIPYSKGAVGQIAYPDLSGLERRHGGMQYPIFLGYDLDMGITFIARDKEGVPWDSGYTLTWDGKKLRTSPVPFRDLMGCDCIRGWASEQL